MALTSPTARLLSTTSPTARLLSTTTPTVRLLSTASPTARLLTTISPTVRLLSTTSPIFKKLFSFKSKHVSPRHTFATSSASGQQQRQQVNCDASPGVDFSQAVEDFRNNGVAILPVKIDEEFVGRSRELVVAAWHDALHRARVIKGHEMRVGLEFGFQEMVLRAPGRFDLHWGIDGEEHFLHTEKVLAKFMPFVHAVFGGEKMTSLNFNGCLLSLPGAKEQLWHIDGEHLYTSEEDSRCWGGGGQAQFFDREVDAGKDNAILPAHCLNVFIPLVDVESNNGGTEFCLGSHFHTKFFNEDIVWQDSSWKDRIGFKGDVLAVKVNAGEVLAFDYRVLHRALEHGGQEARPLLYYTFTKRWFKDAMNFADLPSLKDADDKHLASNDCAGQLWRKNFLAVSQNQDTIYCDGAAGSQIPTVVAAKMQEYLLGVGNTNVGGNYGSSSAALDAVTMARNAGRDLLGAKSSGEIAFGLNCSNLMFHLSRSMENTDLLAPGDNIVLSKACHDANIAPWLLMANNKGLEVRWLEAKGVTASGDVVDDSNVDEIDLERIDCLIDDRTRVVSLGLASNATGRVHLDAVARINQVRKTKSVSPFLILDGTHFVPHRRCSLVQLEADAVVCSAYKLFGPHVGVMAFDKERFKNVRPSKVGIRYTGAGTTDILDCGDVPDEENCQISRWEMGTLNYEGLVGFEAAVQYLSSLALRDTQRNEALDEAFDEIQKHEERLSERFISGITPLVDQNMLSLYGSREAKDRTPTFAVYLNDKRRDPEFLVNKLNEEGVHCTHGNHYAPELVEDALGKVEGVTRISFLHYNTLEEVDRTVALLRRICTL